jgi:hypothetical protein
MDSEISLMPKLYSKSHSFGFPRADSPELNLTSCFNPVNEQAKTEEDIPNFPDNANAASLYRLNISDSSSSKSGFTPAIYPAMPAH